MGISSREKKTVVTFSSRKWATPSTNSRKAANQLRCVSVLSIASRSSFSFSSIWASSSAAEVIAETLAEWEVVRFESVWLNRAIAGSRVGTGIVAGTVRCANFRKRDSHPAESTYRVMACKPAAQVSESRECGHGDPLAVFAPAPIPSPLHHLPT